ncbi:MAG: hypothetical protein JRF63_12795 [Deltaproteobacteria bacterium]|nr:hypothetical protein [Deltaproteobacteria bacterium]
MGIWKHIRGLWRTLFRFVVTGIRSMRGVPLLGEIGDRFEVVPAVIDDPEFGRSSSYTNVLEIIVSNHERWPLGVGSLVNKLFFATDPEIVFNVCFSCHRPDRDKLSEYADPRSHWFNVFFGFYEIDVPCDEWERPFGFKTKDERDLQIEFNDLKRIGKSDWNYFSNYLYGVPRQIAHEHDDLDDSEVETSVADDPVDVDGKRFLECEVDGLEVVSGYTAPDAKLLNNVWFFSKIWRDKFGTCGPKAGFDESFFGVRMKMRFLIRWKREFDNDLNCDAYKTFIYGATINKSYHDTEFNERFLDAQMEAVKKAVFRKKTS